jgi:hypothetical protein
MFRGFGGFGHYLHGIVMIGCIHYIGCCGRALDVKEGGLYNSDCEILL